MIKQMVERRLLNEVKEGVVTLKTSNETSILFAASLVWPMIDSYYIVLMFTLSMIKNKAVEFPTLSKRVQWLAENLYEEKAI